MEGSYSSATEDASQQRNSPEQLNRRLSSNSSTGSFTAISMEDEGLLSKVLQHQENALSQTPPQETHPLRAASQNSAAMEKSKTSHTSNNSQPAWGRTSSFSNPSFVADFTAIPALAKPDLATHPATDVAKTEHQKKQAGQSRTPYFDAASNKEEMQPQRYMPMEVAMGSIFGEELPVDRCIVSGGGFFGGDSMSGSGMQRGARVTQRASDGAVVLELPGARQLLLVHDEQEERGMGVPRALEPGYPGRCAFARHGRGLCRHAGAFRGHQFMSSSNPILNMLRTDAVGLGMRAAKATLKLGVGAGYCTTFLHILVSLNEGTPIHPGTLMVRSMTDSGCVMASILSGVIAGPIIATAYLARLALRPALLAGAVHTGVRWLRRHRNGAAALLKMLSSGDLLRQVEALKGIAKRAASSTAFRREFGLLYGVEMVLAVLADALAAAQAGINAATQEQAADNASESMLPDDPGAIRARARLPRGMRVRGAAAAAKTSRTAAAAAAVVRSGRGGEASLLGTDGQLVPVLGLSGPLPMLATRALQELLRSPEHTVVPLVRAGGVTLLVHVAATSIYASSTAIPSAADGSNAPRPAVEGATSDVLHAFSHTPLAVAALQVLEAVAAVPLTDLDVPTSTEEATMAAEPGEKAEESATKQACTAAAAAAARMQLASDPVAVRVLLDVVRRHLALAAQESAAHKETGHATQAALTKHFAGAWPAVRLLHAVALEPVGKAMLNEARGIQVLAELLCAAQLGSKVKVAAAAALHTAVRGSVPNSVLLASLDLKAPAGSSPNAHTSKFWTAWGQPVGGLLAASAVSKEQAPLRAYLHHELAQVMGSNNNNNSNNNNASAAGVPQKHRRGSGSSTHSSTSGGRRASAQAPANLAWLENWFGLAPPAASAKPLPKTEEGASSLATAAGLSADLCALLCVMDRYHQHAVEATSVAPL